MELFAWYIGQLTMCWYSCECTWCIHICICMWIHLLQFTFKIRCTTFVFSSSQHARLDGVCLTWISWIHCWNRSTVHTASHSNRCVQLRLMPSGWDLRCVSRYLVASVAPTSATRIHRQCYRATRSRHPFSSMIWLPWYSTVWGSDTLPW